MTRAGQTTTLVFDVLGTLLDEDAAPRAAVTEACGTAADVDPASVHQDWVRGVDAAIAAVADGRAPFRTLEDLQRGALRRSLARAGITPSDLDLVRWSRAGHRLDPFPDTVAAFDRLARGRAVIGLTNAGAAQALSMSRHAGLRWTSLVSAETVRAYKPDPRMYAYIVERLELDADRCLFVAAHPWDLDGAARLGFRTAYVDRAGSPAEQLADYARRFDVVAPDLDALADVLEPSGQQNTES